MLKKGYTLAEMVITLTVIGVIAGIIFPTVIKSQPNEPMIRLRKAYSAVSRAANELILDEGLFPMASESGLNDLSGVEYLGRFHSGGTKFCTLLAAKLGARMDNANQNCSFRTDDGMYFTVTRSNGYFVDMDVMQAKCDLKPGLCNRFEHVFSMTVGYNGNASLNNRYGNLRIANQYLRDDKNIKMERRR